MTMQEQIRQALDDLATAPEPVDLAERALQAARRRRATTIGAGVVVGGLVLALAAVGVTHLPAQWSGSTQPGATEEPCVHYTSGSNGLPDVPRDQWPAFVSATLAALPAGVNYSMLSGNSFCGAGAYALINVGSNPPIGHLSIEIYLGVRNPPADCDTAWSRYLEHRNAAAAATGWSLPATTELFCDEPTSSTPLTYALDGPDAVETTTFFADGTIVKLAYDGPGITPRQLASASADPGLHALIPSGPSPVTT